MSLIRWQPHSGLACLSMRMRPLGQLVHAAALGPARAADPSARPGPTRRTASSNCRACASRGPPAAAKSPAGRPLRCQVSRINNRCSGVIDAWADWLGLDQPLPLALAAGRPEAACGPPRKVLRATALRPTKASSACGPGGAPAEAWSTTAAVVRGGVISAGGTTWGQSTAAAAGVGSPAPPQTLAASLGLRPRSAASVCSLTLISSKTCLTPLRFNRCWRGNYSTSLFHFLVENFGVLQGSARGVIARAASAR